MSCEINSPNNDNESIYSSATEEVTTTSKFNVLQMCRESQNNVITEYKCTKQPTLFHHSSNPTQEDIKLAFIGMLLN